MTYCPGCGNALETTGISGAGTIYQCAACCKKWTIQECTECPECLSTEIEACGSGGSRCYECGHTFGAE